MIIDKNAFIEQMLPRFTMRKLTAQEMDFYRSPYVAPETRRPLMVWPAQIPFDGEPADTYQRIAAYASWLRSSTLPKLLLWAKPGLIISPREAAVLRGEMHNLEDEYLGPGKHFVQEEHPHEIGTLLASWYRRLPARLPQPAFHEDRQHA